MRGGDGISAGIMAEIAGIKIARLQLSGCNWIFNLYSFSLAFKLLFSRTPVFTLLILLVISDFRSVIDYKVASRSIYFPEA